MTTTTHPRKTLSQLAVDVIGASCLADHVTAIEWAWWCRYVANAARMGDEEEVIRLAQVSEFTRRAIE